MLIYLTLIEDADDVYKFEQIYQQYNQMMYRVAKRVVKDSATAEDVVHDSFLKIIKHLDKIIDIHCRKTASFIVTIVEHTAIDAYRKRQRLSESNIETITFCLIDPATSDDFNDNSVEKAIDQLSSIYKIVLKLRFIQGFSVKEIATMLDISDDAVQKRIERAKSRLAKVLLEQ